MESETPLRRLGRFVRARRKALKMTQADIQAAGGPSTATLRLIEGGKHADFRGGTAIDLEKAVQWAPGSVDSILAGGTPTPMPGIREYAAAGRPVDGRVTAVPIPAEHMALQFVDLIDETLMTKASDGQRRQLEAIKLQVKTAENEYAQKLLQLAFKALFDVMGEQLTRADYEQMPDDVKVHFGEPGDQGFRKVPDRDSAVEAVRPAGVDSPHESEPATPRTGLRAAIIRTKLKIDDSDKGREQA